MNNERYFSNYVSPNIVIVPTPCNPPSPKRRKIGNNIIVPIVDNTTCENFKPKQENKPNDSNISKKVDEGSSKSYTQNSSWAAKYLHTIGLDKKSSIWNRKIPRKPASEQCVVSTEQPKNATTVMSMSSTYVPKIDPEKSTAKIPKKCISVSNALKLSNKINYITETNNLNIKDKLKKEKPVLHKSSKSIITNKNRDVKSLKISSSNDKTTFECSNKIKSDNPINHSECHDQLINLGTFRNHKLRSGNVFKEPSLNNKKSKLTINHSSTRQKEKCENKVIKSKVKSVIKTGEQKTRNVNVETKHDQTKSDSIKKIMSSDNNYKQKRNNPNCHKEKIDPMINIKPTKIYAKFSNLNKLVSKKEQIKNTELKTKSIRTDTKTKSKTKIKDKIKKEIEGFTSNKKTIESPIKRKTSKKENYRKIKLVINIICNNNSNLNKESFKNENNSEKKASTAPNIDVEFLNDIDIDEIVESLDSCDKKPSQHLQCKEDTDNYQSKESTDKYDVISNILNNNNDTDVVDLIKTLKGEEDDDLIRISTESAENILLSNVENTFTKGTDNSQILSNFPEKNTEHFSTEQKLHEIFKSSYPFDNLDNITTNKNVAPMYSEETNINEIEQETQQKVIKSKDTETQSENIRSDTSDIVSQKLDRKLNTGNMKINEEHSNVVVNTFDDNNSRIHKPICHDNIERDIIHVPTSVESIFDSEHKKESTTNQKSNEILNVDNVLTNKNTSHINSPNIILPTEVNYKSNECVQNTEGIHRKNSEKSDEYLKLSVKQVESMFCNNNKCVDNVTDVKNNGFDQNNKTFSDQNEIPQCNANVENITNQNNLTVIESKSEEKVEILDSITPTNNEDHKEGNVEELCKRIEENDSKTRMTAMKPQQNKSTHLHTNRRVAVDFKSDQKLMYQLYLSTGSKYSINSIIHNGRFSKIYKCKHPNGKYYALKMPITKLKYEHSKAKRDLLWCLVSEIPKNNSFFVNFIKSFNFDSGRNEGGQWCYLMEYYPKNLQQALDENRKPFPIQIVQYFTKQLVTAVMVLKNKGMVHLDIKPQHILINSSNNWLKLCGFDFLTHINNIRTLPNVGTVNYRAPEVILGYKPSYEIDVWSTALVLYEMAANKILFPGIFNNDILYKQICTLGRIPYQMIKNSRFGGIHFIGSKFMRKSGHKGESVTIINRFNNNNRLCNSIYNAYFKNYGHRRSEVQQNFDTELIGQFVNLLHKMLTMCPENRMPIEFVYENRFINEFDPYYSWPNNDTQRFY